MHEDPIAPFRGHLGQVVGDRCIEVNLAALHTHHDGSGGHHLLDARKRKDIVDLEGTAVGFGCKPAVRRVVNDLTMARDEHRCRLRESERLHGAARRAVRHCNGTLARQLNCPTARHPRRPGHYVTAWPESEVLVR